MVASFVDGLVSAAGDFRIAVIWRLKMGMVYWGVPPGLALWLRDEAATKDFVETGTYLADTALWAARHFDRVVSIEADRALYEAARKRLASYANVDVRLGRSQE